MTDLAAELNGRDGPRLRTMPDNLEAEMGLLGGIFIERGPGILDALSYLKPEHFTNEVHSKIYSAILNLHGNGMPVDPVMLKNMIEEKGYLMTLAASAVTPINAKEYGRMVFDLWRRRELIATCNEAADRAYGAVDETESILEQLEATLAIAAGGDADKGGLAPPSKIIGPTVGMIEEAAKSGEMAGLTTGIGDLDRFLGGLMPSDLVIVAARTGMGKTALALTIAKANADKGKQVAFFTLEMSSTQLMMRMLAMESGVAASEMRKGEVSEPQLEVIREAGQHVEGIPLMIDDRSGVSVPYIRRRAKTMKRKRGLDLVIVDYLGLVRAEDRYKGNRVNEVSEITAALKALAKDLDVPVVLLSQLNRALEQRDNKRPTLSDLRDSGSIEQDADVVMFIYREAYYLELSGEPQPEAGEDDNDYVDRHEKWRKAREATNGKAEIIIAKQRMGRTSTVAVHFDGERTAFGDLAR